MDDSVREYLATYVTERTPESYLRLREVVLALPSYDPYSDALDEAETLVEREQYRKAIKYLRSIVHSWVLSPRVHQMLAFAYENAGEPEAARMERGIAILVLEGLLSTGEGTEARPYLVSRVEDEYDVLEYLKKPSQEQSLVRHGERHFDRHLCEDGSSVWFDITEQRQYLERALESRGSKSPWQFWRR